MNTRTFGKLGGICSILLGVSYVVFGITYLLDPAIKTNSNEEFWTTLANHPFMYVTGSWALAFGALLAFAVIPAIAQLIEPVNPAWGRWSSNLAFLGFGVTALSNFSVVADNPAKAAAFVQGDAMTRAAIAAPYFAIDPRGWFPLGCVGLWFFCINLLAWRGNVWSKPFAGLGMVGAMLYWCALIGNLFRLGLLFPLAAGVGGVILAPIWYVWMGVILHGADTESAPQPMVVIAQR